MKLEDMYELSSQQKRSALHVDPRCDYGDAFLIHTGVIRPESPLVFEQSMGSKPLDLISTSYGAIYILSDKVIEVLQGEGFTGWSTFPVQIFGKKGEDICGYHGFSVNGRCGPIENSRSEKVWRDSPTTFGAPSQFYIGLHFAPSTWDGSDIFCPSNTGWVFVVERVKQALEKAKVSNIAFQRLTEVERLALSTE